jgi:hypothetical protein
VGCTIGTNVAPPEPRNDIELSPSYRDLYWRFVWGAFLRRWAAAIPEPGKLTTLASLM